MDMNQDFTVMVVEDTKTNIDILVSILSKVYQVSVAMDGASALELIAMDPPDLILLDIMMPEMNGFEVCQRLKQNPETRDIPIIFLTAKTDTQSIVEGFQAGAVDYIAKPFNVTELLVRVKTQIELSHSRKELETINHKLRHLSIHDDLTGLYNTRYLYDSLKSLLNTSKADNVPLSLLFMDIDNFKYVVDTYGHLNGSRAIQEVAQTIRESIISPCYGVAYGGDEFVVVLPGFDKNQAIEITKNIQALMKETVYLSDEGWNVNLSASFGIAAFPDDAADVKNLLCLADQAMFKIKETGKDAIGCGSN